MNNQYWFSNRLIRLLNDLKLTHKFRLDNDIYKVSEIINILKNSLEEDNFLLRYPKPILEKLIQEKALSAELYIAFKDVFEYYGVEFTIKRKEERRIIKNNEDQYLTEYFNALSNSEWNEFITKLEHEKISYQFENRRIKIPFNEIEKFLDYCTGKVTLHWSSLSRYENIPWNNALITKYQSYWKWEWLHRNPSIKWDFNLVEKNAEYLNWAFVSSYQSLFWNFERINQFKEYLIFSKTFNKGQHMPTNLKGSGHLIYDGQIGIPEWCKEFQGCISSGFNVHWSDDLIIYFKDYWGWKELCSNESIYWSFSLIKKIDDFIDFKSLSSNTNVEWSEDLILQYQERWDWDKLSGNVNLPWSYEFIKKYEDKWKWKEIRYYYEVKKRKNCSLSTNESIAWSIEMLSEWEEKVDFWGIARFGGISENAVIKFSDKFYQDEDIGWHFSGTRDSPRETVFKCSGWENLGLNKKFQISVLLINFLYKKKMSRTINTRYDNTESQELDVLELVLGGNLYHNSNYPNYLINETYVTELQDLTLFDLIEYEFEWSKYLISELYVHDSVWVKLLKPIFSDDYNLTYLKKLLMIIEIDVIPKVNWQNIYVSGKKIGIIKKCVKEEDNSFTAELLFNSHACMDLSTTAKVSTNVSTIKYITGATKKELDIGITQIIEKIFQTSYYNSSTTIQ